MAGKNKKRKIYFEINMHWMPKIYCSHSRKWKWLRRSDVLSIEMTMTLVLTILTCPSVLPISSLWSWPSSNYFDTQRAPPQTKSFFNSSKLQTDKQTDKLTQKHMNSSGYILLFTLQKLQMNICHIEFWSNNIFCPCMKFFILFTQVTQTL